MSAFAVSRARERRLGVLATAVSLVLLLAACTASTEQASPTSQLPAGASVGPSAAAGEQSAAKQSVAGQAEPVPDPFTASASTDPTATETVPPPAVITTPVAPPGGSGVGSFVPEVTPSTDKAVSMASKADLGDVAAAITKVSAVTATGVGPGQITGPAVAVTVKITNDSADTFDLDSVFVNLNDSTGAPGQPSISTPAAPLTGVLAPGATAQGVYVFGVPESARTPVTVLVSNTMAAKVVSFVGDAR